MNCKRCGAELLDTDTFCVKCGQRVDEALRCPNCGEELREGTKFCHKCGTMITYGPEDDEIPVVQQKTVDIPFEEIEQGILLEAEQAVVKRQASEQEERSRHPQQRAERDEHPQERIVKNRKLKEDYISHNVEEDYDEDYEEDEDDDDGEDRRGMKILTVIIGIAIVIIGLTVAFILWQRYNPNRYDNLGDERQEQEEDGEGEEGDGEDGENEEEGPETQGKLQVLSNVNVRTNPDKDNSEVIKVAKTGETYEFYELINNAWYYIRLEDGTDGYVYKDYVEVLE